MRRHALLFDAPLVQKDQVIGHFAGEAHFMGYDHHGSPLLGQIAHDAQHLVTLAWHIGNRHLPAQIDGARILLRRDRIIRVMLEQLGAKVSDVTEPFTPAHGAYHAHEH